MIGDVLKKNLDKVQNSIDARRGHNAFCEVIKRIAIEEINALYPEKVDSDVIVEIYYKILLENIECVPISMRNLSSSNDQYRFRISVRNIFTSNASHANGLANCPYLKVVKIVNEDRKGRRYSYQGVENYVNKDQ